MIPPRAEIYRVSLIPVNYSVAELAYRVLMNTGTNISSIIGVIQVTNHGKSVHQRVESGR